MFIASACMHFVQGLVRSEVKKGRERVCCTGRTREREGGEGGERKGIGGGGRNPWWRWIR